MVPKLATKCIYRISVNETNKVGAGDLTTPRHLIN